MLEIKLFENIQILFSCKLNLHVFKKAILSKRRLYKKNTRDKSCSHDPTEFKTHLTCSLILWVIKKQKYWFAVGHV